MRIGLLAGFLSFILLSQLIGATPAPATPRYRHGEILVAFRPGVSPEAIRKLHKKLGSAPGKRFPASGVEKVRIPAGLSVEEAVARYREDPDVLYAEPNYIRRPFATIPNDPEYPSQWNLDTVDAPEAWDVETGAPGLVIALIDSGMDKTHPDLEDNLWSNTGEIAGDGIDNDGNGLADDVNGWNFVGGQVCELDGMGDCNCPQDDPEMSNDPGNSDTRDEYGHGTHVAGIVAAEGNNGIGTAGLLWRALLMPLKIIDRIGCGSVADEIQAFEYAVSQGADIINASFGGEGKSRAERDAVASAEAAGILVVAAAGNGGQSTDVTPIYPADYSLSNLISVAAVNDRDQLADFSNFGTRTVDIAAPGDCVLSTAPQGFFTLIGTQSCAGEPFMNTLGYLSGTSMAAPHVTGAAGLLLARDASLTPEEIKAIILLTSDPLNALSGLVASSGRLNVEKSLAYRSGSGLSGGQGGCGSFGFTRGGPVSGGTAAATVAGLFWPLLIPLVRRIRSGIHAGRLFSGEKRFGPGGVLLIALIVLAAAAPASAGSGEDLPSPGRRHSVEIRAGYHVYPSSGYFQTNEGFLAPEDFNGLSGSVGYRYRFGDHVAISLAAGRYTRRAGAGAVCCTNVRLTTTYLSASPVYWVQATPRLGIYFGGGIGWYLFEREQTGLLSDHLSESVPGLNLLFGVEWWGTGPLTPFLEIRWARAVIREANSLGDRLDIGGADIGIGISYHFHNLL